MKRERFEITKVSSKGQVVIPNEIREEMGIDAGTTLMVFTDGDNLLMKPVESPRQDAFRDLVRRSRRAAHAAGLKRWDVKRAIRRVRHAGRS